VALPLNQQPKPNHDSYNLLLFGILAVAVIVYYYGLVLTTVLSLRRTCSMLGLLWWTVVATPGIAVSVVFSATPQPESETSVQRQLPDAGC